jgi:hypothetical protein
MFGVRAVLQRLFVSGRVGDCPRCGEPLIVLSEERLAIAPPVFDLRCQCPSCGVVAQVRQVLPHFE